MSLASFFRIGSDKDETEEPLPLPSSFQVLDWDDGNDGAKIRIRTHGPSSSLANKTKRDAEDEDESMIIREYVIYAFGVTREGRSMALAIHGYRPYFYIRVPDHWSKNTGQLLYSYFKSAAFPLAPKHKTCLIGYGMEMAQCMMGFENGDKHPFMKLIFNNSDALRAYKGKIQRGGIAFLRPSGIPKEDMSHIKTYEANLDHVIRFMHLRDIKPCGWMDICNLRPNSLFRTQYSFSIHADDTTSPSNAAATSSSNAKILQASYDIEVYSMDDSFPDPNVKGNVVTQIATCFKKYGEPHFYLKHIITLKECAPIASPDEEGVPVVVQSFATEKQVLLAWASLIEGMDPDIMYMYNGDQFDANYLFVRAKLNGCSASFLSKLSRIKSLPATLKESTFESGAYGKTEYKRLIIPGRIHFDLLVYLSRELKETSYSLNAIAKKYISDQKHDVTPNQMFAWFREGNADKIRMLAEYCIQDTVLPQKIVDKFHILQNHISMANVTLVPFKYLIFKGQQIKVYSQILNQTRQRGFLVPDPIQGNAPGNENAEKDEEGNPIAPTKFKGATVLAPTTGAFFEPITTLDFASLYPSIIRAHGLCYTSIVLNDEKYGAIPGVEYEIVEWNDNIEEGNSDDISRNQMENGKEGYHCIKYAKNVPTIVPFILGELAKSRKEAKALMAKQTDPFQEVVYDKLQLAYKLSMNSMYGFLAAQMIPCKPIAATVTTLGRRMIQQTKAYVERNYSNATVIYGDSVPGYTPILLRRSEASGRTPGVFVECIEKIGKDFRERRVPLVDGHGNPILSRKEEGIPFINDMQVWTNEGWANIRRIIRHKTAKRIYRIKTTTGIVDVTEDHSLISNDTNALLKPTDLIPGTKLLHHSFAGMI